VPIRANPWPIFPKPHKIARPPNRRITYI
jgi:hypothetical protein